MAQISKRLTENVEGDFYVDASCIDCDACRQIAPASFRDHGGQSSVFHQPQNPGEQHRAFMALVACPTASIGALSHRSARQGVEAFPVHVVHDGDNAPALGIERVTTGAEPVRIDDDLLSIPTSGHTRGHQVLLYRNKIMFTGDHLAWSPERNTLTAFRHACWYSWREQTRSMEKLLPYRFEWVLPGHGRIHNGTAEEMHEHLKLCVATMKSL